MCIKESVNMSDNKVKASVSTSKKVEDMNEKEQQKWLEDHPTREEVVQFVSGYINNEVIPVVLNSVGTQMFQLRCRNDVLLKMLIEAGICTEQKFEMEYKKYMEAQQAEIEKRRQQMANEQSKKIIVPDKKIIH